MTPSFTTGSVLVGVIAAGGIAGEVRPRLIIEVAGGVGILIVAGIGGREGGGVEAGIVGVVLVSPPPPPMPPNPMISLIPPIGGIDGVEEEVVAAPPPPPSPNRSLIPPLGVVVVGGTGAGGGAGADTVPKPMISFRPPADGVVVAAAGMEGIDIPAIMSRPPTDAPPPFPPPPFPPPLSGVVIPNALISTG